MTVQYFQSANAKIAYLDEGEGEPILLIHGFASNMQVNWISTSWTTTLKKAGRRVICVDNRGHGESEKIREPERHGAPLMAEDAVRLLDHLGLESADVMGYSMGARITAFMAINHPGRVKRAIFGGLGINMIKGVGDPGPIAEALEAPSLSDVTHLTGKMFRAFAEKTGADLLALAACIRSSRNPITPEMLATVDIPILVAVGTNDDVGGPAGELVQYLRNGQAFDIVGRDHMVSVGDRTFKEAALAFLASS